MSLYAWGVATAALSVTIIVTGAFLELTGTPNGAVTTGLMLGMLGGWLMLTGAVR